MMSGHLCSVGLRTELWACEAAKCERTYCTDVRFSHDLNENWSYTLRPIRHKMVLWINSIWQWGIEV